MCVQVGIAQKLLNPDFFVCKCLLIALRRKIESNTDKREVSKTIERK